MRTPLPVTKAIALIAALLFVCATRAGADDVRTVRGLIVKADPAAKRLTIRPAAGPDVTLAVTDASRLAIGKKDATLADVEQGKRVRATYTERAGLKELVVLKPAVTTNTDLHREFKQAMNAAKSYTFRQKEKYEAELHDVLDDIDDRIDELESQAKVAKAGAKEKLREQIDQLKKQRAALNDQLARVKSATAETWEEVKTGVSAAAERLEAMLKNIRDE